MLERGGLDEKAGFGCPPSDRRGLRVGLTWTALEAVVWRETVIRGDFVGEREGTVKILFPGRRLKMLNLYFYFFIYVGIIFGSKSAQRVKLRGASVRVELRRRECVRLQAYTLEMVQFGSRPL